MEPKSFLDQLKESVSSKVTETLKDKDTKGKIQNVNIENIVMSSIVELVCPEYFQEYHNQKAIKNMQEHILHKLILGAISHMDPQNEEDDAEVQDEVETPTV